MNASRLLNCTFLAALVLILAVPATSALADTPDVIGEYIVTVSPQKDGSLVMHYQFNGYCAKTPWPSDKPWLDAGVPNKDFEITDYGPKDVVSIAEKYTSGGSWVRLRFVNLPQVDKCINMSFTIVQKGMAHQKGEEISFQFKPGWYDFAAITKLNVIWTLPSDATLIHELKPEPVRSNNQAVWTAENLAPNKTITVELLFAKAAYPDFVAAAVPEGSSSDQGQESGGAPFCSGPLLIILIIVIVVIVVIFLVMWLSDDYGGGYIGGSGGSGGGIFSSGGSSGGGTFSTGGRSSGGGGGYSGRGSSCACVSSCACACACAGGGRAGCGKQNGFKVKTLLSRFAGQKELEK